MRDSSSRDSGRLAEIITFYSYKGGTGRTMALANVAFLLAAEAPRGVLMIDWDFEAPGLHRFFRDRLERALGAHHDSTTLDAALDEPIGLLELLGTLNDLLPENMPLHDSVEVEDAFAARLVEQVDVEKHVLKTDIPGLSLIKAGRFGRGYSEKVNRFPWNDFFSACPPLIPKLLERIARFYDYILIDSRTGLTDVSGICTMLLPEKLVLVFTPNRQSLYGTLDLVARATSYRRESHDPRPLVIFPLASRIETSEPERREKWRLGSPDTLGYQPAWEARLSEAYALEECKLGPYFDDVAIQHLSRYSYGEEIAVIVERVGDSQSLTASYTKFMAWLRRPIAPWETEPYAVKNRVLGLETDSEQEVLLRAEKIYARASVTEQARIKRMLIRFVRIPRKGELVASARLSVALAALDVEERLLAVRLADEGILDGLDGMYLLSKETLLTWPRLVKWLADDAEFVEWRQDLDVLIASSQAALQGSGAPPRLSGERLIRAERFYATRSKDLNELEKAYVTSALRRAKRRTHETTATAFGLAASIMCLTYFITIRHERDAGAVIFYSELMIPREKLNPNMLDEYKNRPLGQNPVWVFRYSSLGSEAESGIPYWIFRALPRMFPDRFPNGDWSKFGFDTPDDHDFYLDYHGLPRGFILSDTPYVLPGNKVVTTLKRVSVNCATCHRGEYLQGDGTPRFVDGMPSQRIDAAGFQEAVIDSVQDPAFNAGNVIAQVNELLADAAKGPPDPKAAPPVSRLNAGELLVYTALVAQMKAELRPEKIRWMASRPPEGPGRFDAFGGLRFNLVSPGSDYVDTTSLSTVNLPSIWHQGPDWRIYHDWDGNTAELIAGAYSAVAAFRLAPGSLRGEEMVNDWLERKLEPPAFPFATPDAALVADGKAIYMKDCASCHGSYTNEARPRLEGVTACMTQAIDVGTDPLRARAVDSSFAEKLNAFGDSASLWNRGAFRSTGGYICPPLDGIWARAPYLHNGSVPTLDLLLGPAVARPGTFRRGSANYLPEEGGFAWTMDPPAPGSSFTFDTTLRGNSASGHSGITSAGEIPMLFLHERRALIAYLFTL